LFAFLKRLTTVQDVSVIITKIILTKICLFIFSVSDKHRNQPQLCKHKSNQTKSPHFLDHLVDTTKSSAMAWTCYQKTSSETAFVGPQIKSYS